MNAIQRRLSAYRDELKGIAILMVVFFHAGNLRLPVWLSEGVQSVAYGGVDIFFFLSGYGLYHSLARDNDLMRYLHRRAKRLFPAYLPICVAWLFVMIPVFGCGYKDSISIVTGNLFMMGLFGSTPRMISWYVSGLALSLLLAPFIFEYLQGGTQPARRILILMIISVGIGLSFGETRQFGAIARFPIFILGMGFAMPQNKEYRIPNPLFGWLAFLVGYITLQICQIYLLTQYKLYAFVLIVPPMCIGLGWFFEKTSAARAAFAPLRYCGEASFEIFLFNCWIELLMLRDIPIFSGRRMLRILWSLGSIAMGCAYHAVTASLCKRKAAQGSVRV